MATFVYNQALEDMFDGTIDIDTDTLKVMLVGTGYTPDKDHEVIDNGANDATDPSFSEIVATNYTGGYAGAGRKTATITAIVSDATDTLTVDMADLTWTTIGGAANDTIAYAILVKEITDDTLSRLICLIDFTNQTTNGTDFQLQVNSSGLFTVTHA